ncbi:MAG: gluconolactonase [Candidatus Latescibacterota bacterium]|jgi:gluconolactonase
MEMEEEMSKNYRSLSLLFFAFLLSAFLLADAAFAQTQSPSGDKGILVPGETIELLWDGGVLTEGPAPAADGTVYFSNITFLFATGNQPGHIMRYDPKSGKTSTFRSPSNMTNGMQFDALGRLVSCEGADGGGRRIVRTDMETGLSEVLASHFEGKRFNSPNDLTIDEQGRIYFSDPRYVGGQSIEQMVMGVYRIDLDGSVHLIIADAGKPNGVMVSPDQKTLYVAAHDNGTHNFARPEKFRNGMMAILAYDLHEDGSATFRKVLVDFAPHDGNDGMACDVDGNIYAALREPSRPGFVVFSPAGEELAFIPTPDLPTNAAFGRGAESRTLYLTYGNSATGGKGSLGRIKVQKEGYELPLAR